MTDWSLALCDWGLRLQLCMHVYTERLNLLWLTKCLQNVTVCICTNVVLGHPMKIPSFPLLLALVWRKHISL